MTATDMPHHRAVFQRPRTKSRRFQGVVRGIRRADPQGPGSCYGFSFHGNQAHCREGYRDAAGLPAHLQNVDALLKRALKISAITRLEVHGPESEPAQLREPLAALKARFFALEYGFRN